MFLQMLSSDEQSLFLKAAWLVSISDNPLLWGGKTEDEITSNTDLENITFVHNKAERAILEGFMNECDRKDFADEDDEAQWLEDSLIEKIKEQPIKKQSDPLLRQQLAEETLSELFSSRSGGIGLFQFATRVANQEKTFQPSSPSAAKIMLYELLLLALADGSVSGIEGVLIKKFCTLLQIDDETYDDILERAEGMNREAAKTLSLILE